MSAQYRKWLRQELKALQGVQEPDLNYYEGRRHAGARAATVDFAKERQEVLPAGIRRVREGRQDAPGPIETLLVQQVAVLAEGDADDAIEDFLGDADRRIKRFAEVPRQVFDEAQALRLERQLSDLVNEAYGLTPEEVELMWQTAPPRMPLARA